MAIQTPLDFTESLIKGKIAEIIFQRMFVEMGTAMVIPFGYENIAPLLAQSIKNMDAHDKQDLKNIRNMPDFLLVAMDQSHARLVDVKYRGHPTPENIAKIAQEVFDRWPSAWIFLVTQDGFYFGDCATIRSNGRIEPLHPTLVSKEKQREYLNLLHKYVHR